MPPVVIRVTELPSTLAIQRSSSFPRPPRKAIFVPSLLMAAEVVSIGDGCLTRRWMPSQSMSFPEDEPGLLRETTYAFDERCRRLMKAIRLPDLLQVMPPLYVA